MPKKGLKKKDIKKELNKEIYVEIISYLNQKAEKNFSHQTESTIKFINGRFSEGRTMEDFKHVIDIKTKEWLLDGKMNQYLCPSTLFNPTNFEKYLNQGGVNNEKLKGNARSSGGQTNSEREVPEWQSLVLGSPESEDL